MKPKHAFQGKRLEVRKKGKVHKTNVHPFAAKMKKGLQRFLNRPPQKTSPYTVDAVLQGNKLCRKKLFPPTTDNSNFCSDGRMKNKTPARRSKHNRKTDVASSSNNSNSRSDESMNDEDSADESDPAGFGEDLSDEEEQQMESSNKLMSEGSDSDDYDNMFSSRDRLNYSDVEDDALNDATYRPRNYLVLQPPRFQKTSSVKRKKRDSCDNESELKNGSVQENDDMGSIISVGISGASEDIFTGAERTEENLDVFECHEKGSVVIVARHPASFTLHGQLQVFAISGSVDIYGYTLTSDKPSPYVYSSDRYSNLVVKTLSSDLIKSASRWSRIRKLLECHVTKRVLDDVIGYCDDSPIILLLRKHQLAYATDFVSSYLPKIFHTACPKKLLENDMKGFQICLDDRNAVSINVHAVAVGDAIDAAVQLCVETVKQTNKTVTFPRIMIYGERQFGKSTVLRYLINRLLSNYERVYVLDCDPGQPEFTIPGCLSLTEVTKPLLGPSFTHQKRPVKMAFFGNISLENFEAHKLCIDKLVDCFKKKFHDQILFINTMGWIKGLGKMCLDYLRGKLWPTFEVQIVDELEIPTDYDPCKLNLKSPDIATKIHRFQIPRPSLNGEAKKFSAVERRDASLLAYFGRCQPYFEPIQTLNTIKPYCIRLEDVAIHFIEPVHHKHILQAINASVVALCKVDGKEILVTINEPHRMKFLAPNVDFRECLGFGIVRAIDVEKRLIYLITPEPFSVLKEVNIFVKGNIPLPRSVFTQQKIYEQHIPYVTSHMETQTVLSRKIKGQHYNSPNRAN